jgi:glutathionyl-hydroquinone reductase
MGVEADLIDIKEHYFYSHPQNNPKRIVPLGPKVDIEPLESSGTKRKASQPQA